MKRLWIALAALLACGSANAQSDYPNKPVRLIVDSAAGSANDATARILADKLGQKPEAQMAFQKAAALDPKIAEQLKQQGLYS